MVRHSRRSLLGVSFALTAGLAGCLESPPTDDPSNDSSPNGGNESDPGAGGPDTTEPTDSFDGDDFTADVHQFVHGQPTDQPSVELHIDESGAESWLADLPDDVRPDLESVIADVDFDESVLVSVAGHGPNLCYEIGVSSVDIVEDDGESEIDLVAAAEDSAEDDEACAQQVITVGALVTVTFDGEPVHRLSASVTDANGGVHGMGMAVESATDESSGQDAE